LAQGAKSTRQSPPQPIPHKFWGVLLVFEATRASLLGMLHPCPRFRLGWEQEGGRLVSGVAGAIRASVHVIFTLKHFPCCSENQIMAVKPEEADGGDEPFLCGDLGERRLLTCRAPLAKDTPATNQEEKGVRHSWGRQRGRRGFNIHFPREITDLRAEHAQIMG